MKRIIEDCLKSSETCPDTIFLNIVSQDYVSIHGPEHHIIDGACVLTAYKNAGGEIDLEDALVRLAKEGQRMPGATCGLWGVCGSVTSIGAALAIIDGTGPLTTDSSWGGHMKFTSSALREMGEIGGPRCCKRNAHIAMKHAVSYINEHYAVKLENKQGKCTFSSENKQCIQERCPYYQ